MNWLYEGGKNCLWVRRQPEPWEEALRPCVVVVWRLREALCNRIWVTLKKQGPFSCFRSLHNLLRTKNRCWSSGRQWGSVGGLIAYLWEISVETFCHLKIGWFVSVLETNSLSDLWYEKIAVLFTAISLFKKISFLCVWVFCLHICVCTTCEPWAFVD